MRKLWWAVPVGVVAASLLSSCAVPFYWQAIGGQVEILRKREPIDRLLADSALDPALHTTLESIAAIRRFAVTELELPDNDSYTSYVALDRPYVVWNVVAATEFSVDPERWCFPFAGCVAYRGFFSLADAEKFRDGLTRRGLDTFLGGATAYSTLGYFADPVLSTMTGGGETAIASLLFHELAHQRFYVKGDSELNEAFATAVEEHGTELWLEARGDAAAVERYRRRLVLRAAFADLVAVQQARLREIYARDESDEAKRFAKRRAFAELREDYAARKLELPDLDYDGWFEEPLDNATLAALSTYRRWLPALRARLRAVGLTTFYADVEALGRLPAAERKVRLESWLAAQS